MWLPGMYRATTNVVLSAPQEYLIKKFLDLDCKESEYLRRTEMQNSVVSHDPGIWTSTF